MERSYRQLKASLTPEQKDFMRTKYLKGSYSPGRLMKLVSKVSIMDRLGDVRLIKFRKIGWWLILLSSLGFIGSLITLANSEEPVVAPTLIVFAAIFVIGLFFRMNKTVLHGRDVDNKVRKYALPIIAILREEVRPDSKIEVELNGNSMTGNEYVTKSIPRKGSLGPNRTIYEQQWFTCAAELCDLSKLQFSIMRKIQKIEIKKKNRRGNKTKYKTKYKVLDSVDLRLQVSKSAYCLALKDQSPIRVDELEGAYVLKLKHKCKAAEVTEPNYKIFLQQVQFLYSNLQRVC